MPIIFLLIVTSTIGLYGYTAFYGPDVGTKVAFAVEGGPGPTGNSSGFSGDPNQAGSPDNGGPTGGGGAGGGNGAPSAGGTSGDAYGESGPDCGGCEGYFGGNSAGDGNIAPGTGGNASPPSYEATGGQTAVADRAAQEAARMIEINANWADLNSISKSISDGAQSYSITSGSLNPGVTNTAAGYGIGSNLSPEERETLVQKYDLEVTGPKEFMGQHARSVVEAREAVDEVADKIAQAYTSGIPQNRMDLMAIEYAAAKAKVALAELQAQKAYNNRAVTDEQIRQATDDTMLMEDSVNIARETFAHGTAEEFDNFVESVIDLAASLGYLDEVEDDVAKVVNNLPAAVFDPRDWDNTFSVSPKSSEVAVASNQLAKTMYDFLGISPPNYTGNIDDDYVTKTNDIPVPSLGNIARADLEREKLTEETYDQYVEVMMAKGAISGTLSGNESLSLAAKADQYAGVIEFSKAVNKASEADIIFEKELAEAAHKFGEAFKSGNLPQSENIEMRSDVISEIYQAFKDALSPNNTRGQTVTGLKGSEIESTPEEVNAQLEALSNLAQSINDKVKESIKNGDLAAAQQGINDLKSAAEMSAIALGQSINNGTLNTDKWGDIIDKTFSSIDETDYSIEALNNAFYSTTYGEGFEIDASTGGGW